jgi:hypothetical protein
MSGQWITQCHLIATIAPHQWIALVRQGAFCRIAIIVKIVLTCGAFAERCAVLVPVVVVCVVIDAVAERTRKRLSGVNHPFDQSDGVVVATCWRVGDLTFSQSSNRSNRSLFNPFQELGNIRLHLCLMLYT